MQTHLHAVQHAGAVENDHRRVGHVVDEVRRRLDIEHEERALRAERLSHPVEHPGRIMLIVDRIEREQHVERWIRRHAVAHIDGGERGVGQSEGRCLGPGKSDRILGDVEADERRGRERGTEQVRAVAGTAADVGRPYAGGERFDEARSLR